MSKTKKLILPVAVLDEYFDEGPRVILVKLPKEAVSHILEMAALVKKTQAYKMCFWENLSPKQPVEDAWDKEIEDLVEKDLEDWEQGQLECEQMCISSGHIWWEAIIKHTNIQCETEMVSLEDLEEWVINNGE